MKDSHSFDLGSNPNRSIDLPVSFFILLSSYFILGESFWSSQTSPDMSTFTLLLRRKPFGRNLLKRQGCHFTKLIIEIVDNALADDAEIKPRGELSKEISALRKEVKELKDELKLKTIVLDKYEVELKRYRSAAFLGERLRRRKKAQQRAG